MLQVQNKKMNFNTDGGSTLMMKFYDFFLNSAKSFNICNKKIIFFMSTELTSLKKIMNCQH